MSDRTENTVVLRSPTFEMLAEVCDRAGVNFNETALKKIEPVMLEFLCAFSATVIAQSTRKYIPVDYKTNIQFMVKESGNIWSKSE